MTSPKATGITRILRAFGYSYEGLKSAYRSEAAFRQELVLLLIGIPAAFMVSDSPLARAMMVGSLLLIVLVEIINTAIEATIERISSEIHPLSKTVKDLGSAAVMLSFVHAIAVWGILLLG